MKKRKLISLILGSLLAVGMLSGCGSDKENQETLGQEAPANQASNEGGEEGQENEPEEESGPIRDTIVIATENETPSLHTADHNAVAGDYMNKLTHNGLFVVSQDMEPEPDLVDTYETLTDTQWQFVLKDNIYFHNGEKMTAEDVKATLEWNKDYSLVEQYTKSIESVEVVDELTFIINTDGVQAMLLSDLTHHANYIVPKSLIEAGHEFGVDPIGSGPYKFVRWTRGDSVEFELFEDYFDKEQMPTIQHMIWKIIPEGASRTIALETGEVDIIIEVATTDIPRLEENPDVEVLMTSGTAHHYIMINNELEPFDNVLFRKALSAAIDRESVLMVALDGYGEVSITQTPTSFAAKSYENTVSYDVDLAKQLLEESGVDTSGLVMKIIASNEPKKRATEVVQDNLAVLGVTVEVDMMDLATYLDVTNTTNYTASNGGYNSSDLLAYMKGVHHSNSINASNRARLSNPELDALLDQAAATLDADERNAILEEACALVNDLNPSIPLYQETVKRAFNKDLGGVEVNASGQLKFNNVYWK